jgi:ferredoxin
MSKKITNVIITPGCVSCGSCQVICPEVFEVKGVSRIKDKVDLNKYVAAIEEAAEVCPVSVIKIEEHE